MILIKHLKKLYVQKESDKRLFGIENTSKLSKDIYADNLFAEIANLVNGENTYCAFTLAGKLGGVKGGSSGGIGIGMHFSASLNL